MGLGEIDINVNIDDAFKITQEHIWRFRRVKYYVETWVETIVKCKHTIWHVPPVHNMTYRRLDTFGMVFVI